jgi:VanZ family protein
VPIPSHRSSVTPLLWVWIVLIGYASLYPFNTWRMPAGASGVSWLWLPWPRWWDRFDVVANLLGYLPFGALFHAATVRRTTSAARALGLTVVAGAALSFGMEVLQNFLPQRVPSRMDWALNVAGTLAGALLAITLHRVGVVQRWQAVRDRWFVEGSGGGLVLLMLWPIGLLFPPPLPLGLGQAIVYLPALAADLLADTAWGRWLGDWGSHSSTSQHLSSGVEGVAIMLGLLAPSLLALSLARLGWRRWLLPSGAAALGFAATTLSTALNFGPEHAFSWRTAVVGPAFAAALALAALLALLPRRAATGLGLIVLTALVALVAHAPADPYYAESLQAWEQGRFIRFHGVAQWVGWLWPYATMIYLLMRVTERDRE